MGSVRVIVVATVVAVLALVGVPAAALPPQGPPATWSLSPLSGPPGTEVTLTITYAAGITVWCTEEVAGAPSPLAGEPGWSVALLLTGPDGVGVAVPPGWSRDAGTAALPLGPLPAGDTAAVTFVVPDNAPSGAYTGVGGCVSPDGAQPGPGLASVSFTVTDAPTDPATPPAHDPAHPVPVTGPRYTG